MSTMGIGIKEALQTTKKVLAPELPVPGAAGLPRSDAKPADPEIQRRATEQFKTRESDLERSASASGAQRSENDADVLGYAPIKKRTASRVLFG